MQIEDPAPPPDQDKKAYKATYKISGASIGPTQPLDIKVSWTNP